MSPSPSALMRFYTEVEQTGSSNEFYDKFTIRYHISIIMKSMWEAPTGVHKNAIVQESNNGKNFIKFINMMMNDTTFLLDESLDALKRIHEVQEDMAEPARWAAQPQETQTSRARQLGQVGGVAVVEEVVVVVVVDHHWWWWCSWSDPPTRRTSGSAGPT